jgi:hypothetical protein
LGISIPELGKGKAAKRKAAVKTIAAMLNVNFDTLWNRHRERELKRRNKIAIFVAILIAFLAGIFAYFTFTINFKNQELKTKSTQIEQQRDSLEITNKELQDKNVQIQDQRNDLITANIRLQEQIIETDEQRRLAEEQKTVSETKLVEANLNLSKIKIEQARQLIADHDYLNAQILLLEALKLNPYHKPNNYKGYKPDHFKNTAKELLSNIFANLHKVIFANQYEVKQMFNDSTKDIIRDCIFLKMIAQSL